MKTFEYYTFSLAPDSFLSPPMVDPASLGSYFNQLGSQGWELVTTVETNRQQGRTAQLLFVFKREVLKTS